MQHVYWDVETFSQVNLKDRGAHIYANDKTTGIFFFCYAVDDGEVQTWHPGDPVPAPFANPADFLFVSDNFSFERAIHENILVRRYGFPPIPLEHTDCAERRALAASYPAELGLRCEALGLPFRKDPEARKAMMRLARPQTKKKQSEKPEDPAQRERDLVLLLERCKSDVQATRACYNDPRLPPLSAGRARAPAARCPHQRARHRRQHPVPRSRAHARGQRAQRDQHPARSPDRRRDQECRSGAEDS